MNSDEKGSASSKREIKNWFKRLLRIVQPEPLTPRKFIAMLKSEDGVRIFQKDTMAMMERIALLSEIRVADVMVEREQMVTIPIDASYDAAISIVNDTRHSRFPVVSKDNREVLGVLLAKDLLRFVSLENRRNFALSAIVRPPAFIAENKPLDVLLRDFKATRNHLAVVIDQYGAIIGLVTLEDVLEEIVGEIEDEYDEG